jgi:hypothetical protein
MCDTRHTLTIAFHLLCYMTIYVPHTKKINCCKAIRQNRKWMPKISDKIQLKLSDTKTKVKYTFDGHCVEDQTKCKHTDKHAFSTNGG